MPDNRINLIGISGSLLDPHAIKLISGSTLLVTASRMLPVIKAGIPDFPDSRIVSIVPLTEALIAIEDGLTHGDVAVLVGGDPLFFGIGPILCRNFSSDRLQIRPAVSAMQLGFARLGEAWHDATFLSLHGRKITHLARSVLSSRKLCILTDHENTPTAIARELLTTLTPEQITHLRCFVGENLGCEGERQTLTSLNEIAKVKFSAPNLLIILSDEDEQEAAPVFGLQEHELQHSRGLITKDEVRAAIIHSLAVPKEGIFWDVGAGSGAVSVEIARIARHLAVYAIERQTEQIENISWNRIKYSAWNIEMIRGEAPEALQLLPDPDRIFIGGSGGNLQRIVETCVRRLKSGGRIVVSAVLARTSVDAPRLLHDHGLQVEIRRIEVSRFLYPVQEAIKLNPISVIIGRKN